MSENIEKQLFHYAVLLMLVLAGGCSDSQTETVMSESGQSLIPVILQTDWYAQPEHGGFYQALAKGYYEEEGLAVEIRPGANMNSIPQLVATGRVQFAVGALDRMLVHRSNGIPLVSLFPYFQHDPQCVLFHPESGITRLEDLDGREVMFQAGLIYTEFLQQSLGLNLHLLPMDWSLSRFMLDEQFVQQCFLTSEPIQVRKQGIEAGVIPMSASGFDPYRHVYTNEVEVRERPQIVAAFTRASLRGWEDFISGDPIPAFELIMQSNPQQTVELMDEILDEMKRYSLTDGDAERDEELGQYNKARIRRVLEQLQAIGLLGSETELEDSVAFELLPDYLIVDNGLAETVISD